MWTPVDNRSTPRSAISSRPGWASREISLAGLGWGALPLKPEETSTVIIWTLYGIMGGESIARSPKYIIKLWASARPVADGLPLDGWVVHTLVKPWKLGASGHLVLRLISTFVGSTLCLHRCIHLLCIGYLHEYYALIHRCNMYVYSDIYIYVYGSLYVYMYMISRGPPPSPKNVKHFYLIHFWLFINKHNQSSTIFKICIWIES